MIRNGKFSNQSIANSLTLPIQFPPQIKTYLPYSILSSIILSEERNQYWLYNNFIQLYKKPFTKRIDYYPNQDFIYTDQSLLNVTELNINNFIPLESKDEFIDYIIFWLNNSNYVVVYTSEHDIPGARNFGERPILHSQFIFGYDLKQKSFKIINFSNKTNDLSILDVSFNDISKSFLSNITKSLYEKPDIAMHHKGKGFRIVLLKRKEYFDESYTNRINIDAINSQIFDYINSKNSSLNNCFFTSVQEGTWGISIYNEIIKYLSNSDNNILDFRMFYLIYEHKSLMLLRLKNFLLEYKREDIYLELENLKNISETLKNLCFKYIQTHNIKIIAKMKEIVNKLFLDESEILNKYLTLFSK